MTPLLRHLALVCVSAIVVAACGGAAVAPSPTVTASAASTSSAAPPATQTPTVYNFIADLKATNEVPPIADAEANCAGQAKIALSVLIDPSYYNVTSGKATFDVTLSGCPATTQIVLAHIHAGKASENGPVKVDTGLVATQPIMFVGGAATILRKDIAVEPAVADDLIANPNNYYFNVHSTAHGGGVVRGQLFASR